MEKVNKLIATDKLFAIIGLGKTGLSCARFLAARRIPFIVMDTRDNPPGLAQFTRAFPDTPLILGELPVDELLKVDEVIVSPGVSLQHPALQEAARQEVRLSGDIQLFCREAEAPIVAITGSNAKSTVTALVGKMAERVGLTVAVGGNIGTPALELLEMEGVDLYVLELSSFQLERLSNPAVAVAAILNISEDHMDRYADMQAYHLAKQRIYQGAKSIVFNRAQPLTNGLVGPDVRQTSFALDAPDLDQFGLVEHEDETWLARGTERLMRASEIRLQGRHNIENVLAALALGDAAGFPIASMLEEIRDFEGLPHRCQLVAEIAGVKYYNDSKGTNEGATIAALHGLFAGIEGKVVLIAGGVAKGADFSALSPVVEATCRAVVLIGEAAGQLAEALEGVQEKQLAVSMEEAVAKAAVLAGPGDIVLLSPACASFDMFGGFEERGDCFIKAVEELGQEGDDD
jgi:UDP-N-acetylmuramoylalanine--D-glutamate ligase